jgi:hypothetical protein
LKPDDLLGCDCPVCGGETSEHRLSALAGSYRHRAAHNAWVLFREVAAFVAAKAGGRLEQHLDSRLPSSWISAWRLHCK